MATWEELSEAGRDLAFQALDHATGSLDDTGPMTPFAIVGNDEDLRLHRFLAETLEEGLAQGRVVDATT